MSKTHRSRDSARQPVEQVIERRSAPRYRCCAECTVRPETATGVGHWKGIAYNISTTGVGLALPCPVQTDSIILIEPWRWGKGRVLRARVVRNVPVAFLYFHGCEFINPLTENELRDLIE
jgi:hypothetical protein